MREEGDKDDNHPYGTPNNNPQANLAEISFYAILGKSAGTTMKLQGNIGSREVLILVDSGSTHNFVAKNIVEDLKLLVQFLSSFGGPTGCDSLQSNLPQCRSAAAKKSLKIISFLHWRC